SVARSFSARSRACRYSWRASSDDVVIGILPVDSVPSAIAGRASTRHKRAQATAAPDQTMLRIGTPPCERVLEAYGLILRAIHSLGAKLRREGSGVVVRGTS